MLATATPPAARPPVVTTAATAAPTARASPGQPDPRAGSRAGLRPLGAVEDELLALHRRVGSLQACTGPLLPLRRQTLQRLQVHLFLTASQLLPMWRALCRDASAVDRAEMRLAQLRTLAEQALAADADDALDEARCAVLAEEVQRHLMRTVALLRALDAVAEPDGLHALAGVWAHEGERLRQALRLGLPAAMDNEDADPVGTPPVAPGRGRS